MNFEDVAQAIIDEIENSEIRMSFQSWWFPYDTKYKITKVLKAYFDCDKKMKTICEKCREGDLKVRYECTANCSLKDSNVELIFAFKKACNHGI